MNHTHLLIIDCQNDFSDPNGALFVKGADQDMKIRLPDFIFRNKDKFDKIHVTLDSHHVAHIAHPMFWIDQQGQMPHPFTCITFADVSSGKWMAKNPEFRGFAQRYVGTLEANGKYPLVIWPPHCIIGTWGHCVVPQLLDILNIWETDKFATVNYVFKGSNMFTEHYSAIEADVTLGNDKSTQTNDEFLWQMGGDADRIFVAGEASSHCVANTVRDIIKHIPMLANKIILLKDAMSPVPGFETAAEKFFTDMRALGVKVETTTNASI